MDSNNPPNTTGAIPAEFFEQVKEVLDHFYDLSFLQSHPLVLPHSGQSLQGQALRVELTSAIEALNPGSHIPFLSRESRAYQILQLRYIQKMSVEEIAYTLRISVRQAYRDLRASEENLSVALWERGKKEPPDSNSVIDASSLDVELSRIQPTLQATDINEVVKNACSRLKVLAQEQGKPICVHYLESAWSIYVDARVANQVLLSVFSYALRRAMPETDIEVTLSKDPLFIIRVRYQAAPDHCQRAFLDDFIMQLLYKLKWEIEIETPGKNLNEIRVRIASSRKKVLIVDDNEGLVELMSRYLTDQDFDVYSALQSTDCMELTQKIQPDYIILDIMMPDIDGWDLLQRLRLHPKTAKTRIVVCSVINEPELAKSLGASAFLPKPVKQSELRTLLQAL
jgi:CheY-like chemotaxis protein